VAYGWQGITDGKSRQETVRDEKGASWEECHYRLFPSGVLSVGSGKKGYRLLPSGHGGEAGWHRPLPSGSGGEGWIRLRRATLLLNLR